MGLCYKGPQKPAFNKKREYGTSILEHPVPQKIDALPYSNYAIWNQHPQIVYSRFLCPNERLIKPAFNENNEFAVSILEQPVSQKVDVLP